jgi:PAS domain S-box-containing protein
MIDILMASPLAISYFEDGKLNWTNQAMVELFGAKDKLECLGKSPRDFYPSDEEYNRVRQIVYQSLAAGKLAQADATFSRLDGSVFDGHIMTGSPDPANPRKGTIAAISDISARKRAEQAVRESEERYKRLYEESIRAEELYRSLLNSCIDPIIIYDMDGRAKYVSDSFTQTFGWSREEVLGKRIPFVPESEQEVTMDQISTLFRIDIDRRAFETKRLTRDGRILNVRVSASRYHDHEGKPSGMLVILTDITKNKEAEAALARSERQLKSLSGELLAAHENERKRVAQDLHDGIGQFLNTIKFGIDNALDGLQGVVHDRYLDSLRSTIPLIENAIDEVKTISMDLRPSILDDLGILATLRWFLRQFQHTYTDIDVEKEIGIDEDDLPEPLKIVVFRVLQEALNNVAKHSEANRVHLSLVKTDDRLLLAIRDNGIGFGREATLCPEGPERGFGLASMRERTELSGGSFSLLSRIGEGTEICASWACGDKDTICR